MLKTYKLSHCIIGILLLLKTAQPVQANNITLGSISISGRDTVNNYCNIYFDLSWENSWRVATAPANWDAAYVFVKYRVGTTDPIMTCTSYSGTTINVNSTNGLKVGMAIEHNQAVEGTVITAINSSTQFTINQAPTANITGMTIYAFRVWNHAYLNNTGNSAGTGTAAYAQAALHNESNTFHATTNPALGAFFYRSSNGTGTFSISNARLRWNYGANGIGDNEVIQVKVFALEMVNVPQGAFYVGDSSSTSNYGQFIESGTNKPFLISSENAINWGTTLTSSTGMSPVDNFSSNIPAAFPKGYKGFYCMKYEITQQQVVDYLNSMSRSQQRPMGTIAIGFGSTSRNFKFNLTNSNSVLRRNGVSTPATLAAFGPITFMCDYNNNDTGGEADDGQGIACTDLFYRNMAAYMDWAAIRPMTELEFEKACRGPLYPVAGEYAWGSTYNLESNSVTYSGNTNESPVSGNYYSKIYPLRVGSNAMPSNSIRENAGASYYGIMDLSGGLGEITASVGSTLWRNNFTGEHGNGTLQSSGLHDVATWPSSLNFVTTRKSDNVLRTSDRSGVNISTINQGANCSARGVRTLPSSTPE